MLAGIPVALLGLLSYLLMMGFAIFQREKAETPMLLFLLSASGLAFSVYLTYVEAEVLRTWCVLCVISLFAIGLITLSSALRLRLDAKGTCNSA